MAVSLMTILFQQPQMRCRKYGLMGTEILKDFWSLMMGLSTSTSTAPKVEMKLI